jgi:hypothetical protein
MTWLKKVLVKTKTKDEKTYVQTTLNSFVAVAEVATWLKKVLVKPKTKRKAKKLTFKRC